jgi:hypothetical protein
LDEPFEIGKAKLVCTSDLSDDVLTGRIQTVTDDGRPPSIVAKFLEAGDTSPVQEEFMKGVAVSGFAGRSMHDFKTN